jgi:tetratricopeptide (TPR) repeat protein
VVAALGEGSFEWLSGCAFVLRDGARWRYHLVVREQMLRYLGQRSPRRYGEVHGKLAAYYDGLRNGLGLEVGKKAENETWQKYSLEWIYHELSSAPQSKLGLALNGFLGEREATRVIDQRWAKIMVQVGQEANCETLRKWGVLLLNGMEAIKEKNYEDAIPCFTELLAEGKVLDKTKVFVLNFRSHCYIKSNHEDLALQDALKAVELDRENPNSHYWLALTYQKFKKYESAIATYQQAIALDPDFKKAYANCGESCRLTKRYEEALKYFDRAIKIDNEYSWAIASRGETYQALKLYDEAVRDFNRAIELKATAWKFMKRGEIYGLMNRYDETVQDFNRAIELEPTAWKFGKRGEIYGLMNRYDEAVQDFNRAIELEPTAWKFGKRGEIYRLMNLYDEAVQDFNRAIELEPENTWTILRRGGVHEILGKYENALKDFNMAILISQSKDLSDESLNNPQCRLGILQYKLEHYEVSAKSFQKLVEIYPQNPTFSSNLSYLYLLQDDMDSAQLLINSFMENASFDRLWINFGLLQSRKGQLNEAIQSWQKGLEIMDSDSDWVKAICHVFTVASGNPIEGLENMQQLINAGADRFTLRNALNDATILSRCPQPIPGIDQMIQLLEEALSKFEPLTSLNIS